ncbi:MAG: MFS transporter [Prevotellaceae bacterium]|jgi:ACS family hexuronate transporter-like MFS transporter|nr:MFS transporter [Prevotellaceae bacterium]
MKPETYRWRIVALLFFATSINYIDRQVLGLLKPYIAEDLRWGEAEYGYIVSAFQLAYALGLLVSGRLLDRFGNKLAYACAVALWSLAGMGHALARSVVGFGVARFALGMGESANFPAAIKAVAEWFPRKERALATGIFNSGSNVGAIAAPVIVAGITITYGWRWAFVITGLLGFAWIVLWLLAYRRPPQPAEAPAGAKALPWRAIVGRRSTLAICLARLVTDWVWWMLLFWAPDFLYKAHGVDLKQSVLPLIVIYSVSSVGGIGGGWLSSHLVRTGRSVDFARKTSILLCGLLALSLLFVTSAGSLWVAVALLSAVAAAHQAWASNIYTVVSDIFPSNAVASVTGLAGFTGSIFGVLAASAVGWVLELTGSYFLIFAIAGATYLLAWGILKVMIPRIGE